MARAAGLVLLALAAPSGQGMRSMQLAGQAGGRAGEGEALNPKVLVKTGMLRLLQRSGMSPSELAALDLGGTRQAARAVAGMVAERIKPAARAFVMRPAITVLRKSGKLSEEHASLARGPAGPLGGPMPPEHGAISRRLSVDIEEGKSVVAPEYLWDLVPESLIGKGRKGKVWKAHLSLPAADDRLVAMKAMPLVYSNHSREKAMREAAIMSKFSGGPFVEYVGWWEARDTILLLMELAEGDMQKMLFETFEGVTMSTRLRVFADLMDGLRAMAKEGFVHRDVKPQNILLTTVDGEVRAKLTDFGCACLPGAPFPYGLFDYELDKAAGPRVGTFLYRAPEGWENRWSPKADVFSAGLILYQLLLEGALPPYLGDLFQESSGAVDKTFEDHWAIYDVADDPLLASARDKAHAARDTWLLRALGLTQWMMTRDEAVRPDADAVCREIAEISKMDFEPKLTQQVVRAATADFPATSQL